MRYYAKCLLGLELASLCIGSCGPKQVPCTSLTVSTPKGASLMNLTAIERHGVTYAGIDASVDICDVEVYLTHGDAGDAVRFTIWLPLSGWNGRWQGTGGGGFVAGYFDSALLPAVATGYAAGSTDAGVNLEGDPKDWANSPQLVENFLSLSYHEMTILGKELAKKFYGKKPRYSYWNGCSTGGRQGMSEVQKYPSDYDGVFAGAPGINWAKLLPGMYWPIVLQKQGVALGECQLSFIGNASIEACDMLDGAADGLIGNPLECKFDAKSLVGTEVECDGATNITERDAFLWNGIRNGVTDKDGRHLWYGLQPGTDASVLSIQPGFVVPKQWIADFLLGDPNYDFEKIGQEEYLDLFHKSVSVFGPLWSTDDPDISEFKARGGKLLIWHGWVDMLVPPESTLEYWHRVVDVLGGEKKVDEFYRVFMAPGVGHCFGGPGPQPPADPVAPLVEWVENGKAPVTIEFSGNGQARNVCKYPKQLKYKGRGDTSQAASWKCV